MQIATKSVAQTRPSVQGIQWGKIDWDEAVFSSCTLKVVKRSSMTAAVWAGRYWINRGRRRNACTILAVGKRSAANGKSVSSALMICSLRSFSPACRCTLSARALALHGVYLQSERM